MKFLVEHPVTTPYRPLSPCGGTERFAHQLLSSLQHEHDVRMYVPADSEDDPLTIKSSVNSSLWSKKRAAERGTKSSTNLTQWYTELNALAKDYDHIMLNGPLTAYCLFKRWDFYPKAFAICHYPHLSGESQDALRFQLIGRILRACGGRLFASGPTQMAKAEVTWEKKKEYIIKTYGEHLKKNGIEIENL